MYLRIIVIFIGAVLGAIATGLLRHRPPAPLAGPSLVVTSVSDAGLSRKLDRVVYDRVPMNEFLAQISAHAGVSVATEYDHQDSPTNPSVTLDLRDVSVARMLELVLQNDGVISTIGGNIILLEFSKGNYGDFHSYDVRDLVPATTAARVIVSAPKVNIYIMPPDWWGVDGIHAAPQGIALPPYPEETRLAMVFAQYDRPEAAQLERTRPATPTPGPSPVGRDSP